MPKDIEKDKRLLNNYKDMDKLLQDIKKFYLVTLEKIINLRR